MHTEKGRENVEYKRKGRTSKSKKKRKKMRAKRENVKGFVD